MLYIGWTNGSFVIIIYVFNLITFEIIQIIEDGLLYILTLKFLINYGNEKKII